MMKVTMATKIHKMSITASDEEDVSICVWDLSGTCVPRLEYKRSSTENINYTYVT